MKKISLILFITLIGTVHIHAEVGFSGDVTVSLTSLLAFPYDDERFDTLLNPGNVMGIKDLLLTHRVIAKLNGSDERRTSSFSLWCSLDTYRIAEALLAAAYNDPLQTTAVSETLPFLGTEIGTIEVMRANIGFYVGEYLLICLGRQQMHTGYGYGWNPIDCANPLKDPYDPEAELRGVDGVKMTISLTHTFATSLSGIYMGDPTNGIDFKEVMVLSENTIWLPDIEIMLNGLFEYDEHEGEDTMPSAIGAGFKLNIFDIGVLGEGALRFGSRTSFYDSAAYPDVKTEMLFSALGGLEYVFPNELSVALEYVYNGEGMNKEEKTDYEHAVAAAIGSAGMPSASQINMIIPGYLNRHYMLCHMLYPLYDINTEVQLLTLFSPDGLMLTILPSISFTIAGNLTVTAGYTGLFDFDKEHINEASLSPSQHMVEIEAVFYF
jgi:hypothetical protein